MVCVARVIRKMKRASIRDLTSLIRELNLQYEGEGEFKFRAGQFVMLHVPPKPILRTYSIASEEQETRRLKLLFKYVPGGVASEYVWKLKEGDEISVTGPFGKLFFKEPADEQMIFLNTGSGVSQHLSFLLSHGSKYPDSHYHMFF